MHITDYSIDIKNSSLLDRLRLRQVLLDNDQKLTSKNYCTKESKGIYSRYHSTKESWVSIMIGAFNPNISLEDFIQKFKKHDKLTNLAFYKRSGEDWTTEELSNIPSIWKHCGGYIDDRRKLKYAFDEGAGDYFLWKLQTSSHNFNDCLQVAYEDVFPTATIESGPTPYTALAGTNQPIKEPTMSTSNIKQEVTEAIKELICDTPTKSVKPKSALQIDKKLSVTGVIYNAQNEVVDVQQFKSIKVAKKAYKELVQTNLGYTMRVSTTHSFLTTDIPVISTKV